MTLERHLLSMYKPTLQETSHGKVKGFSHITPLH